MAMSINHEVLLTTEAPAQQWSVSAWDLATGSNLRSIKGQVVAPRCLCLQGDHTLIGASEAKPVLQVWPLCKKDESQQKMVCPGRVSALAISPDGLFCVASIAEKIHVWEMTAGNLLGVLSDSDEVKVIRFTDDGSQFVTGSAHGNLHVWDFSVVVARTTQNQASRPRPRHKVHAHSEPITDLHVGCGGPASRVVTASADHTCKLWDLMSKELIRTLVYETDVLSVIMDHCELHLIAGLASGEIWITPTYSQLFQPEDFVSDSTLRPGQRKLQHHSEPVTCLALSSDGTVLASGSENGTVNIFSMENGNCAHTLHHAGRVTNMLMIPSDLLKSAPRHHGPAVNFQQHMVKESGQGRVVNMTISDTTQWPPAAEYMCDADGPLQRLRIIPTQENPD